MQQATLLFLMSDGRILLAMKKRGFGSGKWNGVGGKLEPNESIEDAARRECFEEIGVKPGTLKEVAKLNFYYPTGQKALEQQVTVFVCSDWEGDPRESEEMAPRWFAQSAIPYSNMWQDDQYWLPKVLAGEYVHADFHFDADDHLTKYYLQ